jgi:hypothetical protein
MIRPNEGSPVGCGHMMQDRVTMANYAGPAAYAAAPACPSSVPAHQVCKMLSVIASC